MRTTSIRFTLLVSSVAILAGCDPVVNPTCNGDATASYDLGLSKMKSIATVEGIEAAENLLFSSTGRLYVSSYGNGVFEIVRGAGGKLEKVQRAPGNPPCKFSGLAEREGILFANCMCSSGSFLCAAAETSAPSFEPVFELEGVDLPNGLGLDPVSGDLFVASGYEAAILRLGLSDEAPFAVLSSGHWMDSSGALTNGLKVFGGKLYWTSTNGLKVTDLVSKPGAGRTIISGSLGLDDFYVDARGMLVTDYLGGKVYALDACGNMLGETTAKLSSPSSVLPALGRLGLGETDLVVTEAGANRLTILRK